ncbi:MAG: tRNA lysidine(34) synthetase TilS [Clostridiales bacterium]|nr:tRNA lysidine(34) synthetase TilS [Clostridiales bacterium]
MINRVSEYIKSNKLIEKGDRIVIGVSGGADSVCLLHILFTLYKDTDVKLIGVHVHHGIRGKEADEDENFVRDLCNNLGIEFIVYHHDMKLTAKEEGLSEEEAGRKIRYQSFLEASKENKCNKVAIAHNKNDKAETFLFNLFRGSAVKGLTGIKPMVTMKTDTDDITIIRPLLFVSREDIERYLRDVGLSFQSDLTNFSDLYTRNKIRNRILTYAKDNINPGVVDHITQAANILGETYDFIDKYSCNRFMAIVSESNNSYEYDVNELMEEDIVIQKEVIRKILGNLAGKFKDIEKKHIEDILALGMKQVGRRIHLPYGMIALKKYDKVKIYLKDNKIKNMEDYNKIEPVEINIPGRTYLGKEDVYIDTKIFCNEKNESFPQNSCVKWFDYDRIENTLILRTRRTGDYLQINSQGGRKKLKDYFIDLKIPKEERDRILLVADGNHIIWIIGYGNRISENYKISEKTNHILSMKLIDSKEKKNDR